MEKNKKYNLLMAILYLFRQAIQYINSSIRYFIAGNFDFFYLFGIVEIYKEFRQKKLYKSLIIFFIFVMYGLIQLFFIKQINIFKIVINVLKICVCYFLMNYVINNYKKINYNSFIKYINILLISLVLISFVFKNSVLWRHNDFVNVFDLNRLQLLFLEPSELGLHLSVLIIFSIGLCLNSNVKKEYIFNILISMFAIYESKSLGAIAICFLSIFIMILIYFIKSKKFSIVKKTLLLMISCILLFFLIGFSSGSSLNKRIQNVIYGKDTSINYRVNHSIDVTKQIMIDTHMLGVGFGNMKTDYNLIKYSRFGINDAGITNSFLNSIAEFGLLAIVIIIYLVYKCLRRIIEDKSYIKLGLFVFAFSFQCVGGYFTAPIFWIIYGIILSDYSERMMNNE